MIVVLRLLSIVLMLIDCWDVFWYYKRREQVEHADVSERPLRMVRRRVFFCQK